jgi:hypothetical protein
MTLLEVITIVQTIAVIAASFFAWKAYRQTQEISREQRQQTENIHQEQVTLAEKQAFIALFEHFKEIQYINVHAPNWIHAAKTANALELIAIAWSREFVDQKLLYHLYGRLFVTCYGQIHDAKDMETGEQLGLKMLDDNPLVTQLYKIWKRQLTRLTKQSETQEIIDG